MSNISKTAGKPAPPPAHSRGFSLLELMVAMVVTLVITGAMYGLVASSQGAFRREPALIERQQQIRIAMNRIQGDVLQAGLGLGTFFQGFGGNGNAVGVAAAPPPADTGVRSQADPLLGGGFPDLLEVRAQDADCPQVRTDQTGGANGNVFDILPTPGAVYPPCYATPSYVVGLYDSGAAKIAVVAHDPAGVKFNFASNENTVASGSEFISPNNFSCDIYLTAGQPCPAANVQPAPKRFAKVSRIIYRLGLDTDGTTSLFRSSTGGFDNVLGTYNTLPPGAAWQVVARGIEDMQIRYRTAAGWQDAAPAIAPPSLDNVVREVEVTLWARALGENNLQGQTLAAGNGVTAVRGSLVTSISPRAAQTALLQEPDPLKRWQ